MTSSMTPEEAQQWADMADDVPGYHDQPASRAYRTIAGMKAEWGVEVEDYGLIIHGLKWHKSLEHARESCHEINERATRDDGKPVARLVRRHVTGVITDAT
ncbi:hypothetical protein [Corynebacterium sp. A21]|uniref:hypothetical protein n=1 Tax=Corynebacterium sp. A21 TaxID=3457318 RepID=UPI003FCF6168